MRLRVKMLGGAAVQAGGACFEVREFGRRYAEEHPGAEIRAELWRRDGGDEPVLLEETFQHDSLEAPWSSWWDVGG